MENKNWSFEASIIVKGPEEGPQRISVKQEDTTEVYAKKIQRLGTLLITAINDKKINVDDLISKLSEQ